jgi:hypothetical protein
MHGGGVALPLESVLAPPPRVRAWAPPSTPCVLLPLDSVRGPSPRVEMGGARPPPSICHMQVEWGGRVCSLTFSEARKPSIWQHSHLSHGMSHAHSVGLDHSNVCPHAEESNLSFTVASCCFCNPVIIRLFRLGYQDYHQTGREKVHALPQAGFHATGPQA